MTNQTSTQTPTYPTGTLAAKLRLHYERHAYKRGSNTGRAPADSARRWRTHFTVRPGIDGSALVRFHSTDIIVAHGDGSVTLNSNGWHSSPTTRSAFAHYGFYLSSERCGGAANTVVYMRGAGRQYVFFDGMRFTPQGELHPDQTPARLQKRVADRESRKAFRDDPDVRDFRAALPVLVASMCHLSRTELVSLSSHPGRRLDEVVLSRRENWPGIVAWVMMIGADTAGAVWSDIYARATSHMTNIIEVDYE